MKLKSVVLIIALVLSVCSPLQITFGGGPERTSSFFTLDFCSAAGAALSVQAEIPAVPELAYSLLLSEDKLIHAVEDAACRLFLPAFPKDDPPEV